MWNRIVIIAALLAAFLPANAQEGGSGRLLRFDPATIQLGDVDAASRSVKVTFWFTNISDAPVSIVDVHAQCGCTVPKFSTSQVKPGQKSSLTVTLLTSELSGPQKRHLTVISTNGERQRYSTITIECNVKHN